MLVREPGHGEVQRHAPERHRDGRRGPGPSAGRDRRRRLPGWAARILGAATTSMKPEPTISASTRFCGCCGTNTPSTSRITKPSTVTRRIERRLALNRSLDIDTYVEHLRRDPRELNSLYEDLLIGVTRFFRDDEAFDALEQRIIPEIVERVGSPGEEPIRVWVPGCATGQEAYSIAILLHEQLSARRRPPNLKILATDVHKASLDVASAGHLLRGAHCRDQPQRLERFFTRKPSGYQVAPALRESIVFAPHNLIRDSPFTKLDLITCRNLLIYFQPHAQKTVLTLFHFALKTGGFLFLGSSESPGGLLDEFDTIDEHAKILPQAPRYRTARGLEAARCPGRARRFARRRCGRGTARESPAAGGLRPSARTLHAAQLSRRRARSARRQLRRRRDVAQGQRQAADAEPAGDVERRPPDRRLRRAAPRAQGRSPASGTTACSSPASPAATRWWPNRFATRRGRKRTC